MSDQFIVRPLYHAVEDRLKLSARSHQVADGYLFTYWLGVLGTMRYCLVLYFRQLAIQFETAQQVGMEPTWPTVEEITQQLGISRATFYRCLNDPQLQRFVRLISNPTVRRSSGGHIYQNRNSYEIEMHTPLIPRHQQWFAGLTEAHLDDILHNPAYRTMSDVVAVYPLPKEDEVDPAMVLDVYVAPDGPVFQNGTLVGEADGPVFQNGTLVDPTSQQSVHRLSTGYPPGVSQNGTTAVVSKWDNDDRKKEDHYDDREDLPPRELLACLTSLFAPHAFGPNLRALGVHSTRRMSIILAQAYVAAGQSDVDLLRGVARAAFQQCAAEVTAMQRTNRQPKHPVAFFKAFFVNALKKRLAEVHHA